MAPRHRAWADERFALTLVPGTPQFRDLLQNSPTSDTLTAVRIIGHLQVMTPVLSEVENSQTIDLGIGVASTDAIAVGATALPAPNIELDFPPRGWLYRAQRTVLQSLPTGGTPTAMWRIDALFEFDLRAMRKIDKGVLFLVVTSTDDGGTSSNTDLRGLVRTLCLT